MRSVSSREVDIGAGGSPTARMQRFIIFSTGSRATRSDNSQRERLVAMARCHRSPAVSRAAGLTSRYSAAAKITIRLVRSLVAIDSFGTPGSQKD